MSLSANDVNQCQRTTGPQSHSGFTEPDYNFSAVGESQRLVSDKSMHNWYPLLNVKNWALNVQASSRPVNIRLRIYP